MGKRPGLSFADFQKKEMMDHAKKRFAEQSEREENLAKESSPTARIKKPLKPQNADEYATLIQSGPNLSERKWEYLVERHPAAASPDTHSKTEQWRFEGVPEYHLSRGNRLAHDQWLNKLGADGWELVSTRRTVKYESRRHLEEIEYIFKREY